MTPEIQSQLSQATLSPEQGVALEGILLPYLNHPKHRTEICLFLITRYFYTDNIWNTQNIQTYRTSYWKWLTYGMWQQLLQVPPDITVRFISLSCTDALRQGIDVSGRIFDYLDRRFPDDDDLTRYFTDIRKQVDQETVPISHAPNALTHSRIHALLQQQIRKQDDLGRASFLAKLKSEFWYGVDPEVLVDEDTQIGRYLQLLDMFFESFDILFAIDSYIDLQTRLVADELTEEETVALGIEPTIESSEMSEETDVTPLPETTIIDESEISEESHAVSYQTIQQQIIDTYGDISTFSPIDIVPVLTSLTEQAEALQDPQINELVYFDTTKNQFVWNDALFQ